MPFHLDEKLKDYATDLQWQRLTEWAKHGAARLAAKNSGVHMATYTQAKAAVLKKAAMYGYAPDFDMVHPVAPGFKVRGTSTLYDDAGLAKLQWVKTDADKAAQEVAMVEAVAALCETIKPAKPTKAPASVNSDLANLYVLTDYHWAALAWHKEGGADWDLPIAERVLIGAFSQMMAQSPDSEVCINGQLGDFIHTDYPGFRSQTPLSGHDLDTDGRPHKVIGGAIRVIKTIIKMASIS